MNNYKLSNWIRASLIVIITVNLIFVVLVFLPSGKQNSSKLITIEKGSSASIITSHLKKEKVIISNRFMQLYLKVIGKDNLLFAGTYIIPTPISLYNLSKILYMGEFESSDIVITIPEGSTIQDIQQILGNNAIDAAVDFQTKAYMSKIYSNLWILSDLDIGDYLEGYLFPDTYNILPDTTAEEIIIHMLKNLQRNFQKLNLDKKLYGYKSFKELIVFASIIQKESPITDMKQIAGVFSNRLKIGKRLESDATVNYFLGTNKLIPNYYDITTKNEYNTYLYSGLPPGAISNPGFSALEASIDPAKHDYLFFLHTPEGDTILSNTFEQHLESRAKYWE